MHVIILIYCLKEHRVYNQSSVIHRHAVFNSVYYTKECEDYTINKIHSDLRHVMIAQHLGSGDHVWLVHVYNLALCYYCLALFSIGK